MSEYSNHRNSISVCLSSSPATDSKELAEFSDFFFQWAPKDDLSSYSQQTLQQAALQAFEGIVNYNFDKAYISLKDDLCQTSGRPLTSLTVVNNNKPFLLDTIISQINESKLTIHLLAHPVLDIENLDGKYCIAYEPTKDLSGNASRLSVIHIHLTQLTAEEKENLLEKLRAGLTQVSMAVKDYASMITRVDQLRESYKNNPALQSNPKIGHAVEVLEWLTKGNFVFVGIREYNYSGDIATTNQLTPTGLQLGILNNPTIEPLPGYQADTLNPEIVEFLQNDNLFIVSKSNSRSLIRHQVWLDYIGFKLFDQQGKLTGELKIIGFFSSTAYNGSVFSIPHLRDKVEAVQQALTFNKADYAGKAVVNILETYPKNELFRVSTKDLVQHVKLILELRERPRTRVLVSEDPFGRFISILIYTPRDLLGARVQKKIAKFLLAKFNSNSYEFKPLVLENSLAYLNYIIYTDQSKTLPKINRKELELEIKELAYSWAETIESVTYNDTTIRPEVIKLAKEFPRSYQDYFSVNSAIIDAENIINLCASNPLYVHFYKTNNDKIGLKLYHRSNALELSERVPLLERMGFMVVDEQSFELPDGNDEIIHMHDMHLRLAKEVDCDLEELFPLLQAGFQAIWTEKCDNDNYNQLMLMVQLTWQQVIILRAYGRYLQQIGISYPQASIGETLSNHPKITKHLYELFNIKFNPELNLSVDARGEQEKQIATKIEQLLQSVSSLDDDLVLRRILNLLQSTLRTNAFQLDANHNQPATLAFKFDPAKIIGLPEPKPYREIFTYGAEVEGVHLRFGKVARGGIRWSDRAQDYRTEVLGLVKAQQVKNAVIIPLGAKGGFLPKKLPITDDRAAFNEAGRQAYIAYISALLSITDNIINQEINPPAATIRYDDNDPYFVVAADKGTATFSDTSNKLSQDRHFWLDDAFASGGSAGYDHKKMSITSRGAWESVKRHFREMDYDIQSAPFTVVGVGDMSGDVFGNGMLLSPHTRLVAAFDHRDIFIDPNPDAAVSFAERQRLFNLQRSSWQDYDKSLISSGGGVFSRQSKLIELSPEAQKALGVTISQGTPAEIMRAILMAPVDLLWFGGIGTYVKAKHENDNMVGDHSNDAIRIYGSQVRAKVIGEGANLGMTQCSRIEYNLNGGRCNTDAIDNSAGVNCSDLEVNIKIALTPALKNNKITQEQRNSLLESMTTEVASLVLNNNYQQTMALSVEASRSTSETPYQERFMRHLEELNLLSRAVEFLPSYTEIEERLSKKIPLSRPEIAVLLAYAKNTLADELSKGSLVKDHYFEKTLLSYFPTAMQDNYSDEIKDHQLRDNIIATKLANSLVNQGGSSFAYRLSDAFNASIEEVVRAYVIIRDGFKLQEIYDNINALDNKIPGTNQNIFYERISKFLLKATSWMVRHMDKSISIEDSVSTLQATNQLLFAEGQAILPATILNDLADKIGEYQELGATNILAKQLSQLMLASYVPDIMLASTQSNIDISTVTSNYFQLAQLLNTSRISEVLSTIKVSDYYDNIALTKANDLISEAMRSILCNILVSHTNQTAPIKAWYDEHKAAVNHINSRIEELLNGSASVSKATVLASLVQDFAEKLPL